MAFVSMKHKYAMHFEAFRLTNVFACMCDNVNILQHCSLTMRFFLLSVPISFGAILSA